MYIRFLKDIDLKTWNQKRKMIQRYDLIAQMYDARYAKEQATKYKAALKNLNIPQQAKILDIGCGSGLLFSHIIGEAKTVIAMDISGLLLKRAIARRGDTQNLGLVQADADHLPFQNSQFDVSFAFTVLQNMPNPLKTLNEMKRITKPKGAVVITGLKKAFSRQAFKKLLEKSGLQLEHFEDAEELNCYVAVTARK